ncbi:hypothetical protein [Desertivirga xinjiangensis]|uniref:hypothetical protein n=1 Tax=Desertivirga xinjiangensis TaxID=539206 RepID=UPI00210DC525|nr:hypothetical protein [Pedobacter xinjiangensis]
MSLKERTDSDIQLIYADSGKHTYQVQISPDGEFPFSLATGFSGKAKIVRISGNGGVWHQGIASLSAHKSVKIDSAGKKETKTSVAVSDIHSAVKDQKEREMAYVDLGRGCNNCFYLVVF